MKKNLVEVMRKMFLRKDGTVNLFGWLTSGILSALVFVGAIKGGKRKGMTAEESMTRYAMSAALIGFFIQEYKRQDLALEQTRKNIEETSKKLSSMGF